MRAMVVLCLLLIPFTVSAQQTDDVLQVVAESAYLRAAPSTDAVQTGYVFANDSLTAIGRNIDGTWLEVRRPGRDASIGWLTRGAVTLTFDVGTLPMTDLTTGRTGPEPIVDTGFFLMTLDEVPLRAAPDRSAETLELIPVFATLPIVERTPDLQWLKVNYRGVVGWLPQFLTSSRADLQAVPLSPEYETDPRYTAFITVTPAQQLAQVDRLLAFVVPIRESATTAAAYWESLLNGQTAECRPPEGAFANYPITPQDILELPELRQQERLLRRAISDLNASIETMRTCGIYLPEQAREANAQALNALTIVDLIETRMAGVRVRILDDHTRLEPTPSPESD